MREGIIVEVMEVGTRNQEDDDYFQSKIDELWATQLVPGVTSYAIEDPRILNVPEVPTKKQ